MKTPNRTELNEDFLIQQAHTIGMHMMTAAETAPTGRGRNTLTMCLLQKEEKENIAKEMLRMAENGHPQFFIRDAENILQAHALLIIGSSIDPLELPNCKFCGFDSCEEKNTYSNTPCSFNSVDLGIALGSAVSTSALLKADTRIMYSAGKAALILKTLGEDVKIAFGIPISISSKSPFFDRKQQ